MSIYALKPKFQNLLRPLVRQFSSKRRNSKSSYANCLRTFNFIRCGSRTIPDIFNSFLPYSYLVVFAYGVKCC